MSEEKKTLMFHKILYMVYLFLTGSILGWCLEVVFRSICHGEIYIPGFLIGPYCPIYGMGMLIITYLCAHRSKLMAYIKIVILSSMLEYVISFVSEMLFHELLWDYSVLPLSIGTRVSLVFSLVWGLLGLVVLKWGEPKLRGFYEKHPNIIHLILLLGMAAIGIDLVISVVIRVM